MKRTTRLVVVGMAAACALPAAAGASTGGAGFGEAGTVARSGSLKARPSVLLGNFVRFRGTVAGAAPGSTVVVERLGRSGAWEAAATAIVAPDGTFFARWRSDHIGSFHVRAVRAGEQAQARAASATPAAKVTVFRPARATWYGPGFYGRRTACGKRYRRDLLGVAHPSLRCGTPVALYYGGRSIVVPVVDRGPYANRASWDLTKATADLLGFTHTARIGALSLGRRGPAPAAPPAPALPADQSGGTTAAPGTTR